MRTMRLVARLVLLLFAVLVDNSAAAMAAPNITSISGVVATGQQLEIVGANFGIKSQAAPLRFDDFETGTTAGHLIVDDLPWWSRHAGTGQIAAISNENCIVGKCGKFVVSTSPANIALRSDSIYRENIGFNLSGKMYVNFWQYIDLAGNADGSAPSFQIKFMNSHRGVMDGTVILPEVQFSHWAYSSPPSVSWYNKTYFAIYGFSGTTIYTPSNTFKTKGWYNISVELDYGTVGSANGRMKIQVSRPNAEGAYSVTEQVNATYLTSAPPAMSPVYPDNIRLGWYHGSYYPADKTATGPTFTSTLYYDNVYIDNSFARVEIGNADVYAACTRREIQIPVSWEPGRITVKLDLGVFQPVDKLFVYVSDEVGNTNPKGYLMNSSGLSEPRNLIVK